MRLRWKALIGAALVMAAAYGEFVRDIRTPRASLTEMHAITANVSVVMADYYRTVEAMKTKYGPDAQTVLITSPPRMVTNVGDKVVEQRKASIQFGEASGLFVIGPRGHPESTFPFQIDPRKAPVPGRKTEPTARNLKSRLGKGLPAKYLEYLEYDDRSALTDRCITLSPGDLGWIGRSLHYQSGTFCVVFWRGFTPRCLR